MANLELPFDVGGDHAPTPQALEEYFERWNAQAGLRKSSTQVYAEMWSIFSRFCVLRKAWPESLNAEEIEQHLQDRHSLYEQVAQREPSDGSLSARYAWRVLRLIDRVLLAQPTRHAAGTPTAAALLLQRVDEYRLAERKDAVDLPEYLPAGEARRLVTYLWDTQPKPGRLYKTVSWRVLRNRTSVGVQLGAGLTPAEVRALQVPDVVIAGGARPGVPWKLLVRESATRSAREVPIARWAGDMLAHWLNVRREQGLPGDNLFPATKAGEAWSQPSQYKTFREVMEDAGIPAGDGGSYKLRHTFALRQLRRRKAPADIARWLGILPGEMERYLRVVQYPVEDLA